MNRDDVTRLLLEAEGGGAEALDRVLPLVYGELGEIARRRLRQENEGHTLDTSALVHEAYLKLVDQDRVRWQNRAHFLGVASMAMRRILVDHARSKRREKRGGKQSHVTLVEDLGLVAPEPGLEMIEVDRLLERLSSFDARAARILECRVFGAMTIEETAAALDISSMTVKRSWRFAKTWLRREMDEEGTA